MGKTKHHLSSLDGRGTDGSNDAQSSCQEKKHSSFSDAESGMAPQQQRIEPKAITAARGTREHSAPKESRSSHGHRDHHIKNINNVAQATMQSQARRPLKADFEPGRLDVICGRGSTGKNHPGNIRFGEIVAQNADKYRDGSKLVRSFIITTIVEKICNDSPEGGFVKKEGKTWFQAGDFLAREKVGQRLRDLLQSNYLSSSDSKTRRRNAGTEQLLNQVDSILLGSEDGTSLQERVTKPMAEGGTDKSDEQIQQIFNKANIELLEKFKREEALQTRAADDSAVSDEKGAVAPIEESRSRKRLRTGKTPAQAAAAAQHYDLISSRVDDMEPLSMSDRLFYEPLRQADAETIQRSLENMSPERKKRTKSDR